MRDDALDPEALRPDLATTTSSPLPDRARGDGAGKAAEVVIGTVHILHREAERRPRGAVSATHRLQVIEQRRAAIPPRRRSRARTLSPKRADIGIGAMVRKPSPAAKVA